MKNKVVFVKAYPRPIYRKPGMLKAVFGDNLVGTSTHIPPGYEKKGFSDSEIDGERLALDVSNTLDTLEKDGFEIHCVSSINSGAHNHDSSYSSSTNTSSGWGYGFTFTEGVLIVAKRQ